MLSFIVYYHAVFGSYLWEACNFMKGKEGGLDLGKRGGQAVGGVDPVEI